MVVFRVGDRTQSWHLGSCCSRPTTARIKADLSLWLPEGTQLGPTSNQSNFSFEPEAIWDTSWTYSKTIIWKFLFWRITHKGPLMRLREPVGNMPFPEDRWLHESSRSYPVWLSATCSVCVYIDPLKNREGVYGGGGGGGSGFTITLYKWTNWEPEMLNNSRTTQPSRNWNIALLTSGPCDSSHHVIDICVIQFSFVKYDCNLDWILSL